MIMRSTDSVVSDYILNDRRSVMDVIFDRALDETFFNAHSQL